MERIEERYIKWILGVDTRTLGYLVREEMQRDKLRESRKKGMKVRKKIR